MFFAARSKARPWAVLASRWAGEGERAAASAWRRPRRVGRRCDQPSKGGQACLHPAHGMEAPGQERPQVVDGADSSIANSFFQAARVGVTAGREAAVGQGQQRAQWCGPQSGPR